MSSETEKRDIEGNLVEFDFALFEGSSEGGIGFLIFKRDVEKDLFMRILETLKLHYNGVMENFTPHKICPKPLGGSKREPVQIRILNPGSVQKIIDYLNSTSIICSPVIS